MTNPIVNFHFRSTPAGNSGWPGADIRNSEVNTAEEVTVVISTQSGGSTWNDIGSTGMKWRMSSAPSSKSDATPTNAGNKVALGGHHRLGDTFEVQLNPGVCKLRIATGACNQTVSTPSRLAVFDGEAGFVRALYAGADLKLWAASRSMTNGLNVVIVPDGGVWKCQHSGTGTGGTDAPSGSAGPFTDTAGKVWNPVTYPDGEHLMALYYHYAAHAGSSVVGENGTSVSDHGSQVAAASYGTKQITVIGSGRYGNVLTFRDVGDTFLRHIQVAEQAPVLADVSLTDQFGEDIGISPAFYCGERPGLLVATIKRESGDPNFSLTGDHAAHFEILPYEDDTELGIFTVSPIADAEAGALDLEIVQTDADAAGGTSHTTTLTGTLLTSNGKPTTGKMAFMQAEAWVEAAEPALAAQAASWAGAIGAADVTVTCNSTATFKTAIQAMSRGPSNTTKYELQLQNGTYEGDCGVTGGWDFGDTGWLRITTAPDHNPVFSAGTSQSWRSVEWVGVTFAPDPLKYPSSQVYQFIQNAGTAATAPVNGVAGRWKRFGFRDCKIGVNWSSRITLDQFLYIDSSQSPAHYWQFLFVAHAESVHFRGHCQFIGTRTAIAAFNIHYLGVSEDTDFQWSKQDSIQYRGAAHGELLLSDSGFDNDDMHIVLEAVIRNETDAVGFTNSAHTDLIQGLRQVNANTHAAGGLSPANGIQFVCKDYVDTDDYEGSPQARIYEVVSGGSVYSGSTLVTPHYFGASAPSGTVVNGQEVNGEVTIKFVGYIPKLAIRMLLRGVAQNSDGPLRGIAARQTMIDSNGNRGQWLYCAAIDVVMGCPNVIGFGIGTGKGWLDFSTLMSQAHLSLIADATPGISDSPLSTTMYAGMGGAVKIAGSVIQQAPYVDVNQTGRTFMNPDCIVQRMSPTSADPHLVMVGPFTTVSEGDNTGWRHAPQVDDSGTNSPAAFRAQMRSIYGPADGVEVGILTALDGEIEGPTSYTLTKNVGASVSYPTPVILTVTLDQAATEAVEITIASTLAGSFAGGPVITIGVGQTTGQVTWTPSTYGVAEFSSSDDAGLSDPPPVTVTEIGTPATAYTLECNISGAVPSGTPATLTVTLNAEALSPVQITLASTLAGSFGGGPTLTIGTGQTTGQKVFTPSTHGDATFSATDDAGLTDPSPLQVTYNAPPVAPTEYSFTPADNEIEFEEAATLTAVLNVAATQVVEITVHASAAGVFPDGNVITIGVGQATGSIDWQPNVSGAVMFTAIDNRDIDPEHTANITVLPAVAPPTMVSQAVNRSSVSLGGRIEITYDLDEPAVEPVTVTPEIEGSADGTFTPPSVIIGIGETTAQVVFQATSIGNDSLLTAAVDADLIEPTPIFITVTPVSRGQLIRLLGLTA